MRKPKFTAFNLAQLIITIAAVMFGVYGLVSAGDPPAANHVISETPDGCSPLDSGPAPDPLDMPDKPKPKPVYRPPVDIPDHPAVFNPDDKGSGRLGGVVKFSDGRGVEGMRVTAISTQVNVTAPQWDAEDIAKTHLEYDRYFRALERNTRVQFTDSDGRFELECLDEEHSYRVSVSHAEVGNAQQVSKSGASLTFEFEVPVIVTGVVKCEGKLPAQWWVTSNADTGQGYFQYVHSAVFSDAEGKFRIRAKAGKVQLIVYAQGWIQDGENVFTVAGEGSEVQLAVIQGATLTGTVTSKEGIAMPNVTVMVNGGGQAEPGYGGWAYPDSQNEHSRKDEVESVMILEEELKSSVRRIYSEKGDYGWGNQMYGYTDANGQYRIEAIRPGTYTVTATMGNFSDSREITLKGGDNVADFSIDSGCRVKIVARNAKGDAVTPQYAWFIGDNQQYAQAVQLPATKTGELEYMGLPEGNFKMTVQANGYPAIVLDVRIGRGSNTFDVTFEEPATLKGKVASAGGRVPANLYVRLIPDGATSDDDGKPGRKSTDGSQGQYFSVDAKGNYVAQNLQPGRYKLSAEFNQNDVLAQQDITIAAGENTQDITLDERCVVTVIVDVAPEIKSKEGITVSITKTNQEGGYIGRYGQLDKNNQAEFAFLPEGEYYAYVYTQDGTQAYVTVTIGRGNNTVNLSLGPPNCVILTDVAEGLQGKEAGLKVGDLVIEYNGVTINNMEDLVKQVQSTKEGDSLTMVVIRNGSTMTFRLNGGRIGINGDNHRR